MGRSGVDSGSHRSLCLDCADSDQPNWCPLGTSTMSGLCCVWTSNGFLFAHGRWDGDEGLDRPPSLSNSPSLLEMDYGPMEEG